MLELAVHLIRYGSRATHSNRCKKHLAISNLKGAGCLHFYVRPIRSRLQPRNNQMSEVFHIPVMAFYIFDFMGFCWGASSAGVDERAPRSFGVGSLSEGLAYDCISSANEIAKYSTSISKINLGHSKGFFMPSG